MKKIAWSKIFFVLLVISLVYNLSFYANEKNRVEQVQKRNQSDLRFMAISGKNVATQLENILQASPEIPRQQLIDAWRITLGEGSSHRFYLGRTEPHVMGELKPEWTLWQHSLLRIHDLLAHLNPTFLEQGSFQLNDVQKEQVEAVVTVFKTLHAEVESGAEFPERVIASLTDQMRLIDDNYDIALESVYEQ